MTLSMYKDLIVGNSYDVAFNTNPVTCQLPAIYQIFKEYREYDYWMIPMCLHNRLMWSEAKQYKLHVLPQVPM